MKILIDMNLSYEWIKYLEECGHETIHWKDTGRSDTPDADIVKWARDNGFVVFTNDLDFVRIPIKPVGKKRNEG